MPTDNSPIGGTAREVEPVVRQAFVGRGRKVSREHFEWKLFVLRKRFGIQIGTLGLSEQAFVYACSLSAKTIVYKGLLLADQVAKYYPDLSDERLASALALVHQRYSTNTFPTWDLAHPFRYLAHSIAEFPTPSALNHELASTGLKLLFSRSFSARLVQLTVCIRS